MVTVHILETWSRLTLRHTNPQRLQFPVATSPVMAIGVAVSGMYTLTPTLSSFKHPTRLFSRAAFTAKLPLQFRASSTSFIDTETNPRVTLLLPPIQCPYYTHTISHLHILSNTCVRNVILCLGIQRSSSWKGRKQ